MLIDSLPETVVVNGREFSIRTDFRICIQFEQLIFDDSVDESEKTNLALNLFYDTQVPDDTREAINAILWFYACGDFEKTKTTNAQSDAPNQSFVYDYDADAEYIYSAFLDQYGIDLCDEEIHWWKFHALFVSLKEDNQICKIIEYRTIDLSTIKNKKERARYARLKAKYALNRNLTDAQRYAMAGNAFAGR